MFDSLVDPLAIPQMTKKSCRYQVLPDIAGGPQLTAAPAEPLHANIRSVFCGHSAACTIPVQNSAATMSKTHAQLRSFKLRSFNLIIVIRFLAFAFIFFNIVYRIVVGSMISSLNFRTDLTCRPSGTAEPANTLFFAFQPFRSSNCVKRSTRGAMIAES